MGDIFFRDYERERAHGSFLRHADECIADLSRNRQDTQDRKVRRDAWGLPDDVADDIEAVRLGLLEAHVARFARTGGVFEAADAVNTTVYPTVRVRGGATVPYGTTWISRKTLLGWHRALMRAFPWTIAVNPVLLRAAESMMRRTEAA